MPSAIWPPGATLRNQIEPGDQPRFGEANGCLGRHRASDVEFLLRCGLLGDSAVRFVRPQLKGHRQAAPPRSVPPRRDKAADRSRTASPALTSALSSTTLTR